ncbi:hypothetical protein CEW46_27510 [Bacillus cereus]|nr:hypothetical protein CEW46_27510 [Bacillus cereus]
MLELLVVMRWIVTLLVFLVISGVTLSMNELIITNVYKNVPLHIRIITMSLSITVSLILALVHHYQI